MSPPRPLHRVACPRADMCHVAHMLTCAVLCGCRRARADKRRLRLRPRSLSSCTSSARSLPSLSPRQATSTRCRWYWAARRVERACVSCLGRCAPAPSSPRAISGSIGACALSCAQWCAAGGGRRPLRLTRVSRLRNPARAAQNCKMWLTCTSKCAGPVWSPVLIVGCFSIYQYSTFT